MNCVSPVLVGKMLGRLANGDAVFIPIKYSRVSSVCQDCAIDYANREAVDVFVPCGHCPLCIKSKKRDVVTRICHESRCSSASWFITLTYDPSHLPSDGSLDKRHLQLFMKRLRKRLGNQTIRYVAVGEYGKLHLRPHYHLIVFGCPDLPLVFHEHRISYDVFRSPLLESVWPFGFSTVTRFDYCNARYVAGYVRKKQDAVKLPLGLEPPFMLVSKGHCGDGGYGAPFFDRFHSEIMRDGFCLQTVRGNTFKVPIPSYYLRRARDLYHDEWLSLVRRRDDYALSRTFDEVSPQEYAQRIAETLSAARAADAKETKLTENRRYENEL